MSLNHYVRSGRLTRRHAIKLLGGVAGAGAVASLRSPVNLVARAFQAGASGADTVKFPKGAIIRTILKDMPPESLGQILVHEHLELSSTFGLKGGPGAPQPSKHFSEDLDLIVEEMKLAKTDGLTAIVDSGHLDQGRRAEYLRQIAKLSGLPVIISGGYHSQPSYPAEVLRMTEDELVDEFVRYAAAERWGAMGEIGISAQITPDERKMQRAVGRMQALSNLPIISHTANGASAVEQLDLFEAGGAKPAHILIGHMGAPTMVSIDVFKTICRRGAFVGFDRVGSRAESDTKQIPMIKDLIDAGFVDNILLSSDGGAAEDILKTKGGPGYARAFTVLGPKLRQAGVPETALHRIMVDNPRRLLAFVPKKITT
jgi:phosphotriesterase-related protein